MLCDILDILNRDLVLAAFYVGLKAELVFPVDGGGLGGVVAVGIRVGDDSVALGEHRHIDVVLLSEFGAVVGQGGRVALCEAPDAVLIHLDHWRDVQLEKCRHIHNALAVVSQAPPFSTG